MKSELKLDLKLVSDKWVYFAKDNGAEDGKLTLGRRSVEEAIKAGKRKVFKVFIPQPKDNHEIYNLRQISKKSNIKIVDGFSYLRIGETTFRDVFALCEPIKISSQSEFKDKNKIAPTVALDGVTDPQNLGSILRSCACLGVSRLVIPKARSSPVSAFSTKVACGGLEYVEIIKVPGIAAFLNYVKDLPYLKVGLDVRASASIKEKVLEGEKNIILVLGAEGRGLSELVKKRVDLLIKIPQGNNISSLNVSVAAAIAMFELFQ